VANPNKEKMSVFVDNDVSFMYTNINVVIPTPAATHPNLMPIVVNSDEDIVIGSAFKHVFETELNGILAFVHTPIN
jgi:hypothetical protein